MHARSAVVDLYGDHLSQDGYWAPIGGIVTLAQACSVRPATTRTAVSRLVREGWLTAQSRDGIRGYAATPLARDRLTAARARIYASGPRAWQGSWHFVVAEHGGDRRRRDQVTATMNYLGYARLAPGTWLSPWRSPEIDSALAAHEARWTALTGVPEGDHSPSQLAARLWDVDSLAQQYRDFIADLPAPTSLAQMPSAEAFRVRTELVHQWRKFLFIDPGLPTELLPPNWPGQQARAGFLQLAEALRPAATEFVAHILGWTVPR